VWYERLVTPSPDGRPPHTHPKGRRRARTALLGGFVAIAGGVLLTGCSGGSTAGSTTTTSTLPPLPPNIVAYVALAGSGANIGNGSTLAAVTVAPQTSVGNTLHVGVYPDAVAVTPNGRLVLVANYTSDTVTPIVIPGYRVLPAIPAGAGPAGIAIAPGGGTAYVTDANGNTVTPIDLGTMRPGRRIKVGPGPQGIAVTPDGSRAYVADAGAIIPGQSGSIGDEVTPINLFTRKALPPIKVGNAPLAVAITPDGGTVFVTNLNSESVSPIDVATDRAGSPIAVDGGPVSVAIAHGRVWVVNAPAGGATGNNLQPITIATGTAGRPIPLPKGAQAIAVTPDDSTGWVVCLNTDRLVPVNLITLRRGATIRLRGGPFAIAVSAQPTGPPPTTTTTPKHTTTTVKATTTTKS
jgi:YVTN family beta-propeller protein